MADRRLEEWAAERVPGLLARAEEEALAEVRALMREALVEAALADREQGSAQRAPAPPRREAPPPSPSAPEGDARWLYAVGRAEAPLDVPGVRGTPVHVVEEGGLTALVSTVPLPEFGEEQLKDHLNDLAWLEDVARAHQRVVDAAFEETPVVPLRLCTIYDSDDRVRQLLREEGARFGDLLDSIEGREEWSVKLFVDPEALEAEALRRSGQAPAEPEGVGAGGAYLARRRSARAAREAADRLAGELAEEVHARLQDWAGDAVVGRPQNPELSGHSGQMLLNGAYLVERDRAERFRQLVDELRERYTDFGARLEMSGPWPPYNFIGGEA